MSKTHRIDIPAKGWTITSSMDMEDRQILKSSIEELLSETNDLAEDGMYRDDNTALCTATIRLTEAVQSLVSAIL